MFHSKRLKDFCMILIIMVMIIFSGCGDSRQSAANANRVQLQKSSDSQVPSQTTKNPLLVNAANLVTQTPVSEPTLTFIEFVSQNNDSVVATYCMIADSYVLTRTVTAPTVIDPIHRKYPIDHACLADDEQKIFFTHDMLSGKGESALDVQMQLNTEGKESRVYHFALDFHEDTGQLLCKSASDSAPIVPDTHIFYASCTFRNAASIPPSPVPLVSYIKFLREVGNQTGSDVLIDLCLTSDVYSFTWGGAIPSEYSTFRDHPSLNNTCLAAPSPAFKAVQNTEILYIRADIRKFNGTMSTYLFKLTVELSGGLTCELSPENTLLVRDPKATTTNACVYGNS